LIFLTVGTFRPFDRLVIAVDELVGRGVIDVPVFAQVGAGGHHPRHMEFAETLDKREFDAHLERADALISHAGMGTIIQALALGIPLLAVPRLQEHGEHVNDHQIGTARKFEELGHILVASTPEDIAGRLAELTTFVPEPRVAQPAAVAEHVGRFLREMR